MPRACAIPDNWPKCVRSAFVSVASMTHWAVIYTRSWCANSSFARVRLASKLEQAEQEIALLREELRIKDGRMAKLPAHNRPFYPPVERLAILEVKAARGWNLEQAARAFLVEPQTIACWQARLDEQGDKALVRSPVPINRLPEFVAHTVRRLKVLCPVMGKKRIAQILARAGLNLGATTVGRMLKHKTTPQPPLAPEPKTGAEISRRVVTARSPNHVWNVDLTTAPTAWGFWTGWFPLVRRRPRAGGFALPQVWPFCWRVALVVDHFSRRCMGFAIFLKEPSSLDIRRFLGRVIHAAGTAPRHVISDRGPQFDCVGYRRWAKPRKIRLRFGAVGQYGSIAVMERFIRSLKDEHTRRILIPFRLVDFRGALAVYVDWHNGQRPHQGLGGKTPEEVYSGSTLSPPAFDIHGPHAARPTLVVSHHRDQPHLPVVALRKAA